MINLANKRILVTGGHGFLGCFVAQKLKNLGCRNIFIPRSKDYDLVKMECVKKVYNAAHPEIVIHLAAEVGGIHVNSKFPGRYFYDNLMMGVQLMEVGRQEGVEKFVAIGTACSYPKFTPFPAKEEYLWDGYPEETNAPYGLAKKMLLIQSQAYRRQYGLNSIFLLPVNLYGPGDNFAPETSHVMPAMIKKCVDAIKRGDKSIIAWGTGKPTREFLYIEDAARGIILATQKYDKPEPVNLASGFEISIKELVKLIVKLTGFKGRIIWDKTKPDGQPRRLLDHHKAYREFGFRATTKFEDGLKKTIDWYRRISKGSMKRSLITGIDGQGG